MTRLSGLSSQGAATTPRSTKSYVFIFCSERAEVGPPDNDVELRRLCASAPPSLNDSPPPIYNLVFTPAMTAQDVARLDGAPKRKPGRPRKEKGPPPPKQKVGRPPGSGKRKIIDADADAELPSAKRRACEVTILTNQGKFVSLLATKSNCVH